MLKEEILQEIIKEGATSGIRISRKFDCKLPTLNPSIKELEKDGMILHESLKKGGKRGGQEKFFHATGEGLDYFLKQDKQFADFGLDKFFRAIFYAYDERYNPSNIEISNLFSVYKQKHSGLKEKFYPIYTNSIFEWTRYRDKRWLYEAIRVIRLFGKKEYLTAKEIFEKLVFENSDNIAWDQHVSNGINSLMLKRLVELGLITKFESDKTTKFRITVFGLLVLFRIIYKEPDFVEGLYDHDYGNPLSYNDLDNKKFSKDLKFIQKTYGDLLPKILSNWNKVTKCTGFNTYNIACLVLLFFVKDDKKDIDSELIGPMGLFDIQRHMAIRYFEITNIETSVFLGALKDWAKTKESDIENLRMLVPPVDHYFIKNRAKKLNGNRGKKKAFYVPRALEFFLDLDAGRISPDDLLMERISIEKAVTNKIAKSTISESIEFQFFAIVRSEIQKFEELLSKLGLKEWFHGYKDALYQYGIDSLIERKNYEKIQQTSQNH